jgi:outer membrane protein OmpA-like peptidoglycan-associated protein
MPENLVDLVRSLLTPGLINRVAYGLGEPSAATQKAVSAAVPALIGSLAGLASTSGGASRIAQILDDGEYDGELAALAGGPAATQDVIGDGNGILPALFGGQLERVVDVVARAGGVRTSSATSLLALIAPLVMHIVGRQRTSFGPSTSALSQFLSGQSGFSPADLASLLGSASPDTAGAPAGSAVSTAGARAQQAIRSTIGSVDEAARPASWRRPFGIGVVLLLLGLTSMWSQTPGTTEPPAQSVSWKMADLQLPGGGSVTVPYNSFNFGLAKWLASTTDVTVPKRFVFDNLGFESGTATLTPGSVATLDSLVAILKAYPPVSVELEGFTDNTGDATANLLLSVDRAEAVKMQIVGRGIDSRRITTAGFGADRPVAAEDTEEGRASNRRLELVVMTR